MNVLVVLGHPRSDSLCGSLAGAYAEGAREAGCAVRELPLGELEFERDVLVEAPTDQAMESDLVEAREDVRWADHLVFVYPNWWGTMPALLKSFFDRTFTSGFAFSFFEEGEGAGKEELLDGRTAELVVTMDVPGWVYRWILRAPGTNALKRATLGFAGIRTTRTTSFGTVEDSTHEEREGWLDEARALGRDLATGPDSRATALRRRATTWLKALRLQFHPMAWVAYTIGALAALGGASPFDRAAYWAGLGFLFFLEAATVLSNDYFDYETDRENDFAGPFTGGSRVLVDDGVSFGELRTAIGLTLGLAGVAGAAVLATGLGSLAAMAATMLALAVLALGYTVPPLRLSYRTLGELDVGLTHSLGVLLCGFVVLGGRWDDPTPWLLSAPFLLSIVPAIVLAGVPDYAADRAAGKRTVAVRFGVDRAATIAGATVLLAALVGSLWQLLSVVPAAYGPVVYLSVPHALGIAWLLRDRLDGRSEPKRIDGLMAASLGYIVWFGVVPLVALL
jgi:putative NADPH-quinone reductase/1,4-dihydroxy-2-naphthoate octaprenyltransferase